MHRLFRASLQGMQNAFLSQAEGFQSKMALQQFECYKATNYQMNSQRIWNTVLTGAATWAIFSVGYAQPAAEVQLDPVDMLANSPVVYQEVPTRTIVFVLGGPGSGKGTQCSKLTSAFPIKHFSAGDLLRQHVSTGTEDAKKLQEIMNQGQIVPAEVTIGLLDKAMAKATADEGITKFLIDGFPRNNDNMTSFQRILKTECSFVLFLDCPEKVMEERLMGRSEGRSDDNIATIRKRFKVFQDQTMPVINHYNKLNKVKRVVADKSADEVFDEVKWYFQ